MKDKLKKFIEENYEYPKLSKKALYGNLNYQCEEFENSINIDDFVKQKNNYYDLIIRFCFINKIYKISKVNSLLEEYNCKLFNY